MVDSRFQEAWEAAACTLYAPGGAIPELWHTECLVTLGGSHAYGTATPESDIDIRGVAVPRKRTALSFVKKFEQLECKSPHDTVLYELRKFCHLASQGNPNIIEVLFVDDRHVLFEDSYGARLRDLREKFLSRKVRRTFSGYAASQLKRIRAHRRWLLDPPKAPPERSAFGLPDRTVMTAAAVDALRAAAQKRVDSWTLNLDGVEESQAIEIKSRMAQELADIQAAFAAHINTGDVRNWAAAELELSHLEPQTLEIFQRERRYREAQREWDNFRRWKDERNPARAELEARHGYDTKHAMHLVRLLRMCAEILSTGEVHVLRPDAEELLAIRAGSTSYEELVEYAEGMDEGMDEVERFSPLPKKPDVEFLDRLCTELILGEV